MLGSGPGPALESGAPCPVGTTSEGNGLVELERPLLQTVAEGDDRIDEGVDVSQ